MNELPLDQQVDLTNCDREPIHIPGAIQPHGFLLAFDCESMQLVHWSANVEQWLGRQPEGNSHWSTIFDSADSCLRQVRQGAEGIVHHMFLRIDGEEHPAAVHMFDGTLITELEQPGSTSQPEAFVSLPLRLNMVNQNLQSAPDLNSLYHAIAKHVREISGYDRVMVYRFQPDEHGSVVGEAVGEEFEPFLGLHYPATDIPKQARRLYKLNTVRSIADVMAQPIPVEPVINPQTNRPLDLSYSCYRAVSPIHVEYLRNMGVRASMSISILREGELWGLIACHHYAPRYLTFEQRAACEVLGLMAGTYLTAREAFEQNRERSQRQSVLSSAMHKLASASSFRTGVLSIVEQMQSVLQADGLAVLWQQHVDTFGNTPSAAVLERLREIAATFDDSEECCWHTDALSQALDMSADELDGAAGCVVIPLDAANLQGLCFFRNEYAREVTWAGEPRKVATPAEADSVRLSPRKSFAAWKETVRGRSREWSENDQVIWEEIRGGLIEMIGRRAAEISRINVELRRLNHDLDSFVYAASHDLREPIRGLRYVLGELQTELGTDLSDHIANRCENLDRLAVRMDELIAGMLRLSRAGQGDLERDNVRLPEVMEELRDMLPQLKSSAVHCQVEDLEVNADYFCLRELLQNLLTNAVKYNDKAAVEITVGRESEQQVRGTDGRELPVYFVKDNGIGIPQYQFDDIFQIFRRLHGPDSFGGGIGAGLAIVKKIVERHGGRIWVESEVGKGTTFYFTLEPLHPLDP